MTVIINNVIYIITPDPKGNGYHVVAQPVSDKFVQVPWTGAVR